MKNSKKERFDAVAVFEGIAKEINSNELYDSDDAYEEEMEERARRHGYLSDKQAEAKG